MRVRSLHPCVGVAVEGEHYDLTFAPDGASFVADLPDHVGAFLVSQVGGYVCEDVPEGLPHQEAPGERTEEVSPPPPDSGLTPPEVPQAPEGDPPAGEMGEEEVSVATETKSKRKR